MQATPPAKRKRKPNTNWSEDTERWEDKERSPVSSTNATCDLGHVTGLLI